MKKISFLLLFISLLIKSVWAHVDMRLGANVNFSTLDLGKIGEASAGLKAGASEEEIEELQKIVNRAFAGISYNLYSQLGWAWDIYQVGGELAFGFNAFSNISNKNQWSSVMGVSPRAYFAFDLFLARLTFLAGATFNFQAGSVPLPKNYNSPKVDLGVRLGVGPLAVELMGAINAREVSQSLFKVGLGLEFIILGG